MKRLLLRVAILFTLGALAVAQSLTAADREKAVHYLEETRTGVYDATKGLSDAQMKFKPAPDRWSIAETLEHITLAEEYLFANITQNIMKAPAGPAGRDTAKLDALILSAVPDRSQKRQAPGPLVPTGRWSPREMLAHFEQSRAKTIAFLKSTPDLREHASSENPFQQPMDAYQWVLFIAAHSERHTKQIAEVKADPNFPKN
jgi:uncharacterized damage-inducible protein DinB